MDTFVQQVILTLFTATIFQIFPCRTNANRAGIERNDFGKTRLHFLDRLKFTVAKAGRQAFLLDVGQKMARRWHVEIDGQVVADFNNFWLPPTTSWHTDLTAGEHTILVKGEVNDRPTVFFRPSMNETVLRSPVAEALDYVVFAGKANEVIAS